MSSTIRFYDPEAIGTNFKMAVLTGYTFNASHRNWSEVSSYDIGDTGTYTATGAVITASFSDQKLYITDFDLYFVTASSVSHLVVYNSDTNKLIFAVEYDTAQDWNNSHVTFDWPEYIEVQSIDGIDLKLYPPTATIKFYQPTQVGNAVKMAVLSGYTFNPGHKNWSEVSSYDIGQNGEYPAEGYLVSFAYADNKLSVTDFPLYIDDAQNVSHVILYNSFTKRLILAIELVEAQSWEIAVVTFNWPDYILIPPIADGGSSGLYIEIELRFGSGASRRVIYGTGRIYGIGYKYGK